MEKNNCFDKARGKLGFGFMRLPMKNEEIDYTELNKMVDIFLESGFNYFDTAHGYLDGKSEIALKASLVDRYPRESYLIADKLSAPHFNTEEEIRPLVDKELSIVGVDYFDYFLMHAQDKDNFAKYKRCRAYEIAFELKAEGKVKHVGMSFHDEPALLEEILTEYPDLEFVQIQLNYADYDDVAVQSRECLEVCKRHGKPAIVMEPVKGGTLVNIPKEAEEIFRDLGDASIASYAIRFAAGCDGVEMVLSGMGTVDMMNDNVGYMKDFEPLSEREHEAIGRVLEILKGTDSIPCTDCRYCMENCPKNIPIPKIFACLNSQNTFHYWNTKYYYGISIDGKGKASDCIGCGVCERACPQHLKIRELLKKAVDTFEKKKAN